MAYLEIKNVRIAGIAAGVPEFVASNLHPLEDDGISTEYTPEAFVETTGVLERHISDHLTTADLCYKAAEKLISDLNWDKSEIEAIVFVTQTPDFILPATACIMQDRLGLSKECFAEDMSLGCSGWIYGLSSVGALVASGSIKKALLMVGDGRKRAQGPRDPLFGHAGTVTAIEYAEGVESIKFHVGTDGSGFDAIITPDGGSRNMFSVDSFKTENVEGKQMHRLQARMKGMDVFSFGITTAPKSVKSLAEHYGFDYLQADWFVFHQANMKMNSIIAKKLKLPMDKVPSSMYRYGNTNGGSIPMTIVAELKGKVENKPTSFVCCGFGVGLSWGTVAFKTDKLIVSDVVLVSDEETDKIHVV